MTIQATEERRNAREPSRETHVTIVVDGNPRPKGRPRIGRGGIAYTPRSTRLAENTVKWEAAAAMSGRQPFDCPIVVTLRFFTATARLVDVDNLAKLALDALNRIVWVDDSQIVQLSTEKAIDRARPRTEILVRPLSGLA